MNTEFNRSLPTEFPACPPWRRTLRVVIRAFFALSIVGILVGTGLGYLKAVRTPAKYETEIQVLVIARQARSSNPFDNAGPNWHDAAAHARLLKSPLVISRAVEKFRLAELESFKTVPPQDVARMVVAELSVERVGDVSDDDAFILQVSYRSPNIVDATTVTKSVVRAYEDFLNDLYQSNADDTVRLLTQARDELGAELKKKRDELRRFVKAAPGGATVEPGEPNPSQAHLDQVRKARLDLELKRAQLRAASTAPATQVEQTKKDLAQVDNEDRELAVLQDKAEKEVQYLQDFQTQYKIIRDEIVSIEELYSLVLNRFKQIDLVQDTTSLKMKIIAPPDAAWQVEPNMRALLIRGSIWGGGFGAAIGLVLAVVIGLLRI